MSIDPDFTMTEKAGLYKAVFSRRDVRSHFIDKKIPDDVLVKLLNAAHHAPSVGYSQPWDFVLIKNKGTRLKVKNSFILEREKSISLLDNDVDRQDKYTKLKLEGILESDINICITYDPERFGPRHCAGDELRHRRTVGRRQVDDRAAALPLLRSVGGAHHDRRAGYRPRAAA